MRTQPLLPGLLLFAASAFALDSSFRLVMHDSQVNVYSRLSGSCRSEPGGPDVLFVIENRTPEKLEMSLDLLSLNGTNRMTVTLEPSGNTSVLSLDPEADACQVQLVGMKIQAPVPPKAKEKAPAMARNG
jgi:hypothetical protein